MTSVLDQFSPQARIRLYGCDRPLSTDEQENIQAILDEFSANWYSHGKKVTGSASIVSRQFILFCAESTPSGCSIDNSVSLLKQMQQDTGIDALAIDRIYFREAGDIRTVNRFDFAELVKAGKITADSVVVDLSIDNLADLRANGGIEKKFADSWHSRAFKSN
jgi:hypothetical protein